MIGKHLIVWTASALLAAAVPAQPAESPCTSDERYRALDFWLGTWKVVDASGVELGKNHISATQGGCLVVEHWTSANGSTGQSMNYFDPGRGHWRQHWVDEGGGVVHYEGQVAGGAMRFVGENIRADGSSVQARVLLEPLENGRVHHLIEHSADGGRSWDTYFEATYFPVAEAPIRREVEAPVAATEPPRDAPVPAGPAPETPPLTAPPGDSAVVAVSGEQPEDEIPIDEAPQIAMASPMTLEVELGQIDKYPDGAGWQTDETARFACDRVTIKTVSAQKRRRRGSVEVTVSVDVHSPRRKERVDLAIALVTGDRTVAEQLLGGFSIGLMVPAHDSEEGLEKSVSFTLPEDEFEALFSGTTRPKVRLTLTTR